MKFKSENLKLTRNFLGLNQKELAERLNISQALISQIENGTKPLNEEIVQALSPYVGERFFLQDQSHPNLRVHYRVSTTISKKITDAFEARLQVISNNIDKLLETVEIPENKIPMLDLEDFSFDVKYLANEVRTYLGFGREPIRNLVEKLEMNGVIIHFYNFDFVSEQNKTLDGVSFFVSGVPVILVNSKIQNSRKYFTIAHELGHIIMHLPENFILKNDRDLEKEANEFASELLAPSEIIKPELFNLSLDRLFYLKAKWNLSASAILYKAKDLTLTPDQYRRWVMKMSQYRKNEPNDITIERPALLRKIFEACTSVFGNLNELNSELGINKNIYNELYSTLQQETQTKLKIVF